MRDDANCKSIKVTYPKSIAVVVVALKGIRELDVNERLWSVQCEEK